MTQPIIQLQITFDSLLNAITTLEIEEKIKIFHLLEAEIAQLEEEQLEEEPTVLNEIEEARIAYQNGDYQTLDQFLATRKCKIS